MEKTKKSVLTKERIILSAKECFLRNGFKETKVDDLAKLSNVDKRTIYRYFPSKESLLLHIVNELFESFSSFIVSLDFDINISGLKKISHVLEEQYKYAINNPEAILLMGMIDVNIEMNDDRKKELYTLSQSGKKMDENLAELIEFGKKDGSVKNSNSSMELAVTINNSLLALATRTVIYTRSNISWKYIKLQAKLLLAALEVECD